MENIYNKIKQSIEDGEFKKRDRISKLFPPSSPISKMFYTRLHTLNLTNSIDLQEVDSIRLQTLLNSLENIVDAPIIQENSITREDLRGEEFDLYSIYIKILNVTKTNNFNDKHRLGRLQFESSTLRKQFYTYIKTFELTNKKISFTNDNHISNNFFKKGTWYIRGSIKNKLVNP